MSSILYNADGVWTERSTYVYNNGKNQEEMNVENIGAPDKVEAKIVNQPGPDQEPFNGTHLRSKDEAVK